MLRQVLDLYACIRPVRYFAGSIPRAPPERVNSPFFGKIQRMSCGIECPPWHEEPKSSPAF